MGWVWPCCLAFANSVGLCSQVSSDRATTAFSARSVPVFAVKPGLLASRQHAFHLAA